MDDGFIQKGSRCRQAICCFAIQGFEDKSLIKIWMDKNIGKSHVDTNGGLRLSVEASKELCKRIGKFIIYDPISNRTIKVLQRE